MKNGVSSDCNTKSTSLSACHPVTNKAITKGGNYMEEVWKPVKGYEGLYEVSNTGKVRSLDRETTYRLRSTTTQRLFKGKILNTYSVNGYRIVAISKTVDGRSITERVLVHRLVAESFIPNPNGLPEVNHIDEDKTNNCVQNLEWISHRENALHGTALERGHRKLRKKVIQFTKDGQLVKEYESLLAVRKETGWHIGKISKCANGNPEYPSAYGYTWRFASDIDARESI